MRHSHPWLHLSLGLALTGLGCEGSVRPESFFVERAAFECDLAERCGWEGDRSWVRHCRGQNFEARHEMDGAELVGAVEAGRARFDANAAADCLRELELGGCESHVRPEVCERAIEGLVPLDGVCAHDRECVTGARCDPFRFGCGGVCVSFVPIGGVCGSTPDCVHGALCEGGECVEFVRVGCHPLECPWGQECVPSPEGGTCVPAVEAQVIPEGEACDRPFNQPTWLCEPGLVCAGFFGDGPDRCVPRAGSGEPCQPLSFPDDCPDDEMCLLDFVTNLSDCVLLPEEGAECSEMCGGGLMCLPREDGVRRCVRRQPAGGPCLIDIECATGACGGGRCAPICNPES